MGVNSLWKVLDEAGCGQRVGIDEMSNPNGVSKTVTLRGVNPWNVHQKTKKQEKQNNKKVVLAVDLSIWICESLSSSIAENHANPAIHLVFTRTVKLLSMGIGLVFVIEGKRRIRDAGITKNDEADKFRRRRSGTAFWKACRNCHDMLKLMGVVVVRAKAEGEALCALLNQKGLVDGVISNDGDCLLFGAKVVYTKFSIDNLENRRVIRYDSEKLSATIQATDDRDVTAKEVGNCPLSREDLISFALLTGSDLAGSGLDKVGYKKAIRFIRKCKLDNPLHPNTAAIEELKSWARSIAPCDLDPFDCVPLVPPKAAGKCCSHCNHPGSKSHHLKHGCEVCGTAPGEACLECTSGDRFRQSLRIKALALFPKFDPSQVVEAYSKPNENLLPLQFSGNTNPEMIMPDLDGLMKMKSIVKGRSLETSREYLKTAIGKLLSRAELLKTNSENKEEATNKPVPLEIVKAVTVAGVPSYNMSWRIDKQVCKSTSGGDDRYEYSTVEPQELVKKRFPDMVKKYLEAEKERTKQGDGEKERRRAFLAFLKINPDDAIDGKEKENYHPSPCKKRSKRRQEFFRDEKRPKQAVVPNKRPQKQCGDDVRVLLRGINGQLPLLRSENSTIESIAEGKPLICRRSESPSESYRTPEKRHREQPESSPLFVQFGSFLIPITPIDAMVPGEFPPRRIYIRHDQCAGR